MLRSRIIPCLLIHNNGVVKTVNFKEKTYIGDPINTVKIFNEMAVDELMVVDIDATVLGKEPNFRLIEKIANESRMPLCIGGGIKTAKQAESIFSVGVEKIALSSAAVNNPELIREISNSVGSQSVVAVLDVKKNLFGKYQVVTHNAKNRVSGDIESRIKDLVELGVGELVVNSVDGDGVMRGYDYALFDKVYAAASVPVTILGGAGCWDDIKEAIARYKIIGVAAGSVFVFKGKYKAVLISYPDNLI